MIIRRSGDGAIGETEEIDYLCAAASEYFRVPVTREQIVWTYSGVRPLYDDGASKAQETTREYVLKLEGDAGTRHDPQRLRRQDHHLSPPGGSARWRKSKACWVGAAPPGPKAPRLPGGDFPMDGFEALVTSLRTRAPKIAPPPFAAWRAAMAPRRTRSWQQGDLGRIFGADLGEREVAFLMEKEWARSADDILWRRTKLGLRFSAAEVQALTRYLEEAFARSVREERWRISFWRWTKARLRRAPSCSTGRIACAAWRSRNSRSIFPRSGWVEHDPEDIWRTVLATMRGALADAKLSASDIAAIGITNQRETTLIWDRKTGKADPQRHCLAGPPHRRRRASSLRRDGMESMVTARTGLLLDPYFSATKVAMDTGSGRRRAGEGRTGRTRVRHGGHVSVVAAHRRQSPCHRPHQRLAHSALRYRERRLGRRPAQAVRRAARLAAARSSSAATISARPIPALFGAAIPIRGVAGDQQAATMGQACFRPAC